LGIYIVLQLWVEVIAMPSLSLLLNGEFIPIPILCLPRLQNVGTRVLILLVSHLVHSGIPFSNFSMNVDMSNVVKIPLLPFHLLHLKITIFLHFVRGFFFINSVDLRRHLKAPVDHHLEIWQMIDRDVSGLWQKKDRDMIGLWQKKDRDVINKL
jgi:hypothetical protein